MVRIAAIPNIGKSKGSVNQTTQSLAAVMKAKKPASRSPFSRNSYAKRKRRTVSTGTSKNKDFVQPIVESILDEAMSRVDGPNQQNEEGMVTFRNVMFFY